MALNAQLKSAWTSIFTCKQCCLASGYSPQFRPTGKNYKPGGVVFVQINPGHIGCLNEEQIVTRYKSAWGKDTARLKAMEQKFLLARQIMFQEDPTDENWNDLCQQYRDAMQDIWGWPPGKYRSTIEMHGVDFDDVSVVNLAQCPVPDDKYRMDMLERCWDTWTKSLLDILKPRIIVAQGKLAYDFLQDMYEPSLKVIQGVHHASRQANRRFLLL